MGEGYFTFKLYGDNRGYISQVGKFVFQNRNNIIRPNNVLPCLVFHYITNYNLDDLELFFRLVGFSTFTKEELPSSIIEPIDINLPNKNYIYTNYFGGSLTKKKPKHILKPN